ncbi:hypothetical protein [Hoeflea alexandrii]|uniref:AbiU2 domain-containing protein n=1 Tax=Hoeflea alexandrii TaxID=288436 RepID=UPI0022AFCFB4|nr:hypothetical protein [Hoeflea alexandrii]MCZ4287952.1 hypothetical protein [Hoeflea alexandrii]
MADEQDTHGSLAGYQQALGQEFGRLFYHCISEWVDLSLTWQQYEQLFGHGPERVSMLNEAGAAFFGRVQRHFFDVVVLAICRLSDPVKSRGKKNLTVNSFEDYMDTDERRNEMKKLLADIREKTQFHRDWRNRRIGHNDLDLRYGTAKPLESATRNQMNESITAIHQVFFYILGEFEDSHLVEEVIEPLDGPMVTLQLIYDARTLRAKEQDGPYSVLQDRIASYPKWLMDQ